MAAKKGFSPRVSLWIWITFSFITKMREESVVGRGWVSDDSSFYGGEDEQERLLQLCEVQPRNNRSIHDDDLNSIAFKSRSKSPAILSNVAEGRSDSWQLGETVSDFVKRLPPLTASRFLHEWIWVHDPYIHGEDNIQAKGSNVAEFIVQGRELLAQSVKARSSIMLNSHQNATSTVTRMLGRESTLLEQRIADLAVEMNVLSGKWMLFPVLDDLTRTWSLVVDGVIHHRLGPTAKVAPDEGKPHDRLICVYTKDFRDQEDVRRVLREMISLGIVSEARPIYYKSDAYTLLDIYKGTAMEYGLHASLYSSQRLLTEEKLPQTVLAPRAPTIPNNHFGVGNSRNV